MNGDKFGISIVLAGVLCTCSNAQVMDIGTNFYRDYLDFAQNKGVFAPQDTPLNFNQKGSGKFGFEKIPNNGARNNKGNFTALGRNFVVTATHTLGAAVASNFNENRGWFGNTKYEYLTSHTATNTSKDYNSDTTYMRTTKYIVEGRIDPLDVANLDISGDGRAKDEANANKIQDYIKEIRSSGGGSGDNIYAYQAGSGGLGLEKPKADSDGYDAVVSATEFENQGIINSSLGGSVSEISSNYSADYKLKLASINKPGVYLFMSSSAGFRNRLLPGDSGSGFFVYDAVAKKWTIVGVLSAVADSNSYASIVTMSDFKDYKKDYEHTVSGLNITDAQLVKNKDNILSAANGSDIALKSALDLGHGGIVVNGGNFTLRNGSGDNKIVKFAGFDISSGASLNLNVTADTDIHKVGKGNLVVNSVGNKTLRIGEGGVELSAANAFEKIYVTSGRGSLKLGVSDNLNDKIFFGDGGGELDLNGYDQNFANVSANSNAAKITNSSAQRSTLRIEGASDKEVIFHASASKNLDIKHSGQGRELVFDGGFDIDGGLTLQNAKATLQGHPTTHAVGDASVLTQGIKDKLAVAGVNLPEYMDLSRPSTLAQPDWDRRNFSVKEGINLSSSELTIGKDAQINGDINAEKSTINLSGEIRHYIDEFDGSNTYDDGLKYRQRAQSGNLLVDEVNFQNKIVMDSDSMLKVGGATKLKELVINGKNSAPTRSAVTGSGKFEIENLEVSGANKLSFEPDTAITKTLNIKNFSNANEPILDFKKVLTLGAGMKFEIDFTTALKGQMSADETYTLVSATNIVNNGALFNTEQKIGELFATYDVKDGKILMKLSDTKGKNPSATPGANNQSLKIAGLSERQNRVLDMFKGSPEYANALQSGDTQAIRLMAIGAEADMREISTASFNVSVRALQNSNELINSRLSHIAQLRAKADISQFRLAGLESDFMPTAAMAYEAAEAQRQRNNFWANINGAYFKDRQNEGDLKFYGTSAGYDRSYDELIFGVSAGFSKAKFDSNNLNDDAKIYSFGAYGLFEREAHEFQSNLNFAFIRSKQRLAGSQEASVKSTGILSSNYYKYKISLSQNGRYSQSVKPVFALEFGANGIKGFKNDRYKQKDINDFNVALGIGAEYALSSDKNAFSAQFLLKQSVYSSEDKTYVALNNSSGYVDYKLDNNKLSYNLKLEANTKLAQNLALSYQLSTMVDNDRNYGVSGGVKMEYKF